jgi:hypothetical protein
MSRLNLTLKESTMKALNRYAQGRPTAQAARELLEDALGREAKAQALRKLARDYAAGRHDALELLTDFEPLVLEVLGEERE